MKDLNIIGGKNSLNLIFLSNSAPTEFENTKNYNYIRKCGVVRMDFFIIQLAVYSNSIQIINNGTLEL